MQIDYGQYWGMNGGYFNITVAPGNNLATVNNTVSYPNIFINGSAVIGVYNFDAGTSTYSMTITDTTDPTKTYSGIVKINKSTAAFDLSTKQEDTTDGIMTTVTCTSDAAAHMGGTYKLTIDGKTYSLDIPDGTGHASSELLFLDPGTYAYSLEYGDKNGYTPDDYIVPIKIGTFSVLSTDPVVSPSSITFESAKKGTSTAAEEITITNLKSLAIPKGSAGVTVSGNADTSFEYEDEVDAISANSSVSFSVKPKDNLAAGTYTDSLVVKYKEKTIKTVTVSYTVTEDGVKPTPTPTATPTPTPTPTATPTVTPTPTATPTPPIPAPAPAPEYDAPDTAVKN